MSARDRRLAEKYRAKGMQSATETARSKEGRQADDGILGRLRGFDYNPKDPKKKIEPVPLGDDSKERAHKQKSRLPKLG